MAKISTKNWPATKNCERAITDLKPHPRNTKTHPPEQIKVIAGLIRKFGWTNRVLITEDNLIIAGHGRVLAAKELGIATIPCALAEGWSDADIRAYMIADNKSGEMGPWDEALLIPELRLLGDEGVDLGGLGFTDDELDALLGDPGPDRGLSVPLTDRFGVVPFTVLNAREGWWQDRKRAWLALGIRSEVGRGDASPPGGSLMPAVDTKTGRIARSDSKARAIPGTTAPKKRAKEAADVAKG
jgi:ParB-like chromosome segregation protein Spo0J